jgi:hypothetical protein
MFGDGVEECKEEAGVIMQLLRYESSFGRLHGAQRGAQAIPSLFRWNALQAWTKKFGFDLEMTLAVDSLDNMLYRREFIDDQVCRYLPP